MTLNITLLRTVVLWAMGEEELINKKYEKIKEYSWYQPEWARKEKNGVCQTAYCIAGAAAAVSGYKIKWETNVGISPNVVLSNDPSAQLVGSADMCYPKGHPGQVEFIEDVAQDELGISVRDAENLFNGDNDIDDVVRAADEIASNAGKKLFTEKQLAKMSPAQRGIVENARTINA